VEEEHPDAKPEYQGLQYVAAIDVPDDAVTRSVEPEKVVERVLIKNVSLIQHCQYSD
jgi:hypothetical protein